jgi:hypothetical protein
MPKILRNVEHKNQQQKTDWWAFYCRVHKLDQGEEEKKLLKILKLRNLVMKISIVEVFGRITEFLDIQSLLRCWPVCRLWNARRLDPFVCQHSFVNKPTSAKILCLNPPDPSKTFNLVKTLRLTEINELAGHYNADLTHKMCDRIVVNLINLEEIKIEGFYDIAPLKKIFDAFAGKLLTVSWTPTYKVKPYLYNQLVFHKLKVLTLFMCNLTAEVVYEFLQYLTKGNAPQLESLTLQLGLWCIAPITSFAFSFLMSTQFIETVSEFKTLRHFKLTSLYGDSFVLDKFKTVLTTDWATELLQGTKVVIEVSECNL